MDSFSNLIFFFFLHLIPCVLLQFCELRQARIYNTRKRNPVSSGGNEGCLYLLSWATIASQHSSSKKRKRWYLQWMCGSRSRSLKETECNSREREKRSSNRISLLLLVGIQKKKENWTTTRRVVRYECIEPTNSFLYSLTSTAIGLSSSSSRIAGSILIFIFFFLSFENYVITCPTASLSSCFIIPLVIPMYKLYIR